MMGTRTGNRGDGPSSYDDEGLRAELARVRMQLKLLPPRNAGIRKSLQSRLHNLERVQFRRS
jgi:hypothetical protein